MAKHSRVSKSTVFSPFKIKPAWWKERTNSGQLSSGLHTYYLRTHIYANTKLNIILWKCTHISLFNLDLKFRALCSFDSYVSLQKLCFQVSTWSIALKRECYLSWLIYVETEILTRGDISLRRQAERKNRVPLGHCGHHTLCKLELLFKDTF